MNGSTFLTVSQAAKELDVSRQAIQLMIQEDRIKAIWMLEKWAIPESEVTRIKKERKQSKAA